MTLLIDWRGKIDLLKPKKNKIVFIFFSLAFPCVLFITLPIYLLWFLAGMAVILILFLIIGFGEVNFLGWSNIKRIISGFCFLAFLVPLIPSFPSISSIEEFLFLFMFFSGMTQLVIPAIGVGLIFSTIPKKTKNQYFCFRDNFVTGLCSCSLRITFPKNRRVVVVKQTLAIQ